MKKILTIVGARPQIIKASAISRVIKKSYSGALKELIVHTGQHYDENMSKVFFQELAIPEPDYNLHVGSGSHGAQTAKMLQGIEDLILTERPNAVLVYGDTNSTIAGALAAAKLHVPLIHVEAGLRSFNKAMPEEINRISCDHMSTLLFTPTKTGLDNLSREGFSLLNTGIASINNPFIYHCGDVMYDNSNYFSSISDKRSEILKSYHLVPNQFILGTIHRDSNTDVPERMEAIFTALIEIAEESGLKVVLPLHPRTRGKLESDLSENTRRKLIESKQILIIPPAGFLDIIALEKHSRLIVTDSGGLQKEAYFFEKPCVILRPETEWVEIVENGTGILVDADKTKIIAAVKHFLNAKQFSFPLIYGDGNAAGFICQKIIENIA